MREEFLNGPPYSAHAGKEWTEEEKASITKRFERLIGNGMDRWTVGTVDLPGRGVGYITVPCCPLCRQHIEFALEQVRADAEMRMDELEERLDR